MTERTVSRSPVVSVIIIFLNAERFLQEAIDSVLAQTFDHWELLLVDDGSTDRSTEIARLNVRRLAGKAVYLEHDAHVNRGMSASRNLGIEHARGEFIALLDSDDVWYREKLQTEIRLLTNHPEAGMVAAPAMKWFADGTKEIQTMNLVPGIIPPGGLIPPILRNDDNSPSSVLFRTSALKGVGGFETSFKGIFEDQILHFKMTLAGPVYFNPEPSLLYRMHADSCCASTPSDLEHAARMVLYARLAEFITVSNGPLRRRGLLLDMVRTRLGELILRSEPHHRETAKALDSSGAVNRQGVGWRFMPVLLAGSMAKDKATAVFRKMFDLIYVAYQDGIPTSASTLPRLATSALRRVFPRLLQSRPVTDGRQSTQP